MWLIVPITTVVLFLVFFRWVFLRMSIGVKLATLYVIGWACMDAHIIVLLCHPEIATIKASLWGDKDFSKLETSYISIQWYLYGMGRYFGEIVWSILPAIVCRVISYKLFKLSLIFIVPFIIQFCFYCWNRNTSMWANFWVYLCMGCAIIYLLIPEKQTAKYRGIDT